MKELLKFFDKFDEIVFISDTDTHEILYMNQKLKDWLGYGEQESGVGKKCYNVLQGLDEPCPFCSDHVPTKKMVSSCIHKNAMRNKRFLINDTLIQYDNRLCRLEIAIDVNKHFADNSFYDSKNERILNECMQKSFSNAEPEEAIKKMLSYLGKTFLCNGVYIFKFVEESADISYKWHKKSIDKKKIPQSIPFSSIGWWLSFFLKKETVTIPDLEEIRTDSPEMYQLLKSERVKRLVAAPIIMEGEVVGFLEMSNPGEEMFALATSLINMICYFIASLLTRSRLLIHLRKLSYYDSLTGALNRNALFEGNGELLSLNSVGIIYCDITGLKKVNDTSGHAAGDKLIQGCYVLLRDSLSTQQIYRIGGDEFVAMFRDCSEIEFLEKVTSLKKSIEIEQYHIAVGYVWTDKPPFQLDDLLTMADGRMYKDKQQYYAGNGDVSNNKPEQLNRFFGYCDEELFFRSISQQNTSSYFFMGDIQKNMFYISDNLRDDFGFSSNEVSDFLNVWEERIAERSRGMYRHNIESMLQNKSEILDMRYKAERADGRTVWVH